MVANNHRFIASLIKIQCNSCNKSQKGDICIAINLKKVYYTKIKYLKKV